MRGCYMALLGIDGIGKSTLARAIAQEAKKRRAAVELISWRGFIESKEAGPWPKDALQQLWLETYRCLFSSGASSGRPVLTLPRSYAEWRSEQWETRVGSGGGGGSNFAGAIAASIVETAGNVILYSDVIRKKVDDGLLVLQETFPYKHVAKELLIARKLLAEGDAINAALLDTARSLADNAFMSMQPDVGIHLDGDPRLAYKWRTAESGRVGALEDFGAAGEFGPASFLALQELSAAEFREKAARWGWISHTVNDEGLEQNVRRGLRTAMPAIESVIRRS
jgi:hypothetical protein